VRATCITCLRNLREKVCAHSFQAPTLIGCLIVKERFRLSFAALAASEAEKRDYEAHFLACQAMSATFLLRKFKHRGFHFLPNPKTRRHTLDVATRLICQLSKLTSACISLAELRTITQFSVSATKLSKNLYR
jgi:hypothetical protein